MRTETFSIHQQSLYAYRGFRLTVANASTKLRTAAIMATSLLSWLMAEPTPIPDAPAAIASGAVTFDNPEAHNTGTLTAREIS
jgi:hypothetical protein